MRVSSQVAERLKTQDFMRQGNISKILKLDGDTAQCPVSPSEKKIRHWHSNTTQKQDIKIFRSCLSWLDLLIIPKVFCKELQFLSLFYNLKMMAKLIIRKISTQYQKLSFTTQILFELQYYLCITICGNITSDIISFAIKGFTKRKAI